MTDRRAFVKQCAIGITAATAGFAISKFVRKQDPVVTFPADAIKRLCDLARGSLSPVPGDSQIKEFQKYLLSLQYDNSFITFAYLNFDNGLLRISKEGESWAKPAVADLLLNQYFQTTDGEQNTVFYAGRSIRAAEVPLKDMLLFFATGKTEAQSLKPGEPSRLSSSKSLFVRQPDVQWIEKSEKLYSG